MSGKDIIKFLPNAVKAIAKYKKVILTIGPLWVGVLWVNDKLNTAQEHIKLIESIPVLERKFSEWAIEMDSTDNAQENEITVLKHIILGELKVRKVGSLKMFLNNAQEAQEHPSGGFMYESETDNLYEVWWSPATLDYYKKAYIQKVKGDKVYTREIKVYLEYDK